MWNPCYKVRLNVQRDAVREKFRTRLLRGYASLLVNDEAVPLKRPVKAGRLLYT